MAVPNGFAKNIRLHKFLLLAVLIASPPAACFRGIESEAHRKAEEFLEAHASKCGESFFSKAPTPWTESKETVYEFRDVSFVFRSQEISRAAELNGWEYYSNGALEGASRSAEGKLGSDAKLCWSEWSGLNQYFEMARKKGVWTISSPLQIHSPVDCSSARKIVPCNK